MSSYHGRVQRTHSTVLDTHTDTAPDAQMSVTPVGATIYKVGDTVTYNLNVMTSINGGDVPAQTPLSVTDQIPGGFSNLVASGTDWNVSLDNTTSPATMKATYTGSTPISAGTTLSSITLTGTVTDQAAATLTNTATLALSGDSNSTNDTASATIQVQPSSSPTTTPTPEPTTTPTPEPTTTSSPTPISTSGPNLTANIGTDATGCTNIGDQITYTVTVTNGADAGPVGAGQPITVAINLPDGLSDVTPSGGTDWQTSLNEAMVIASYSGSYPVAPGASLTPITITATMQTPSSMSPGSSATVTTTQDTNSSNDTGSATLTICTPNLLISTTHQDADAFQVGQSITYTLGVSNAMSGGPVIAGQPVMVTDAVPSSISQVTPTGSGWNFTTASSSTATTVIATYTGDYPILTGDSLPDITISGILTNTAAPTVVNSATVATPLDSDTSDNTSSDSVDVAPAPDLALSSTHIGDTCIPVRQDVAWTLNVTDGTNAGSVLNGPITVTDTLPVGLSNIRTDGSDWSIIRNGMVVTATYAGSYPIDPASVLSPITVKGTVSAPSGATLINTAIVSTPGDGSSDNDTTQDSMHVCSAPVDLGISFTHGKTRCFTPGDPVTYTVLVANGRAGTVLAGQPIIVTVTLPNGLSTIAPNGGTSWQLTTKGATLTATYIGSYPVKPKSVLTPIMIRAILQMPSSSSLIGYATVKTPRDGNVANNTARDVLNLCAPKLVTSKTYRGSESVHAGQSAMYTITVNNKSGAGPVVSGESIHVTTKILRGLKQVKATGTNWQFTITSSPVTVVATYSGQYPVVAGTHLPDITLSGVLTSANLPTMTIDAAVKIALGGINVEKTPHRHVSFVMRGISGQTFIASRKPQSFYVA